MSKKVFIGVGHGGSDPGAVKYITEKEYTLKVAFALGEFLSAAGVDYKLSRTQDIDTELNSKVAMCNAYKPDLVVDVHFNAGGGQGFEVYYADVDSNGMVSAEDIISHIDDKTILVSVMHVNNETGALMPVEKIGAAIDHKSCVLHVDAVQSYGKIDVNPKRLNADMISISSHKIHGPNGVGALYVKKGLRLAPIIYGGKQESGLRSGTENLAAICGFAKAAEIKFARMHDTAAHVAELKEALCTKLVSGIDNVVVNSPRDSIYAILNVSFPGLKSEVLLHILESKGIYVSTGSACNSKKKLSYVLSSMGIKDNVTDAAVRFSLSEFNTMEDVCYTVQVLQKEVPLLRKIMR